MTNQKHYFIYLTLLLCLIFNSAWGLNLGTASFSSAKGEALYNPHKMVLPPTTGSSSPKVNSALRSIGGVNFQQIAVKESGIDDKNLQLVYLNDAVDGSRLKVILNKDTLTTDIYDWELIPIANYANTDNYACFTLFGKLKDKEHEKKIREENKISSKKTRILNYHPQLTNTLLGLRLFQMDIMIIHNNTSDLPKEGNKYILGKGEVPPNVPLQQRAAVSYRNHLNRWYMEAGMQFKSYMISDFTAPQIMWSIKENALAISGTPHYFAWSPRNTFSDYQIQRVYNEVRNELCDSSFCKKINNTYTFSGYQQGTEFLLQALKDLDKQLKEEDLFQENDIFKQFGLQLPTKKEQLKHLSKFSETDIMQFISNIKVKIDNETPRQIESLSKSMSSHPNLLKAINPAVWNATVKTMRYAAFFRYVKENHKEAWDKFVKSLENIEVYPKVTTPTLYKN